MIESAPFEPAVNPRDPQSRQAFMSSHRALSVCARELARLADELTKVAQDFAREREIEAPVVRRAPDRTIVQVGPVALTVAWLRNGSDLPAAGELMAMVWRGVIAPRGDHMPERLGARNVPATPVQVWEETLVASGTSEASWHWHPVDLTREGYASPELAVRFLDQLRQAYDAASA